MLLKVNFYRVVPLIVYFHEEVVLLIHQTITINHYAFV